MLPLGPPDAFGSPYTSSSAFATWRALLADPRRAGDSRAELGDFRRRNAYWAGDWERFAGPGALADQVRFDREWSALRSVRGGAGDPPDRRHPDLRRRTTAPTSSPIPSCSPRGWSPAPRPTSPIRKVSSGGSRSTTGVRCAGRATAGGSSASGARWTSSTSCGSTTSAASSPTGRCRPGRRARCEGRWHRGPGAALFRAVEAELGGLPLIAEDLGPDHPGRRPAAGRARAAGHANRRPRVRQAPPAPARGRRPSRGRRRLHRHPRPPDMAGWVGGRLGRRPRARRGPTLPPPASTRTTSAGDSSGWRSPRAHGSRSCRCRTFSASAPRRG